MTPSTQKQWTVKVNTGFDGLKLQSDAPVPKPGNREVLVKFHAASLNFRDLLIAKGGYPFATKDVVIPGSDGAGVVEGVGDAVTLFKKGDRVVTLFSQEHIGGPIKPASLNSGLGGIRDGVLREYGVLSEQGLVHAPENLNMVEAASLSCAGLTAWNALYGLESKALKAGQWVLTQGTGGVSLFALQLAKAAGAKVIATTSSAEKSETLKKLGADHVINYKEDSEWGTTAKKLTTGQEGVDHVIEVGGPGTMAQSLEAIKFEGVISVIGFLGGAEHEKQPSTLDALTHICTIRGLLVGSRVQFEDLNQSIAANDVHPVIDKTVFGLDAVSDAYQHMWDQKHFGNVCVKMV